MMISFNLQTIVNLATVLLLLAGLFFMLVAALGLWRLPDFYHRMHAATKGATLGMLGVLVAALIYLPSDHAVSAVNIFTKALLTIIFLFIANPVGAHLLSKAAHLDGCTKWQGMIEDELDEA